MVDIEGEAGPFAAVAAGVLVNLGTPHEEQRRAMVEAAEAAAAAGTPWVLDPVAIGGLPVRTALAHKLVGIGPTIVRGNASEVIALAGSGAAVAVSTAPTPSRPRCRPLPRWRAPRDVSSPCPGRSMWSPTGPARHASPTATRC